jgi:HNH endonuclease
MGRTRSWSDEDLILAHKNARSISAILRQLVLQPTGGNYEFIYSHMERLGLDRPDPRDAQAWSKGQVLGSKHPIEYYLVSGRRCGSDHLRRRILKEGLKPHKCESCGLTEWMGKRIPLELDHIDGDRANNLWANLRLLCPNCHSQTDTYRGKNIRGRSRTGLCGRLKSDVEGFALHAGSIPVALTRCIICNEGIASWLYWHTRCSTCIDCGKPNTSLRCKSCAGHVKSPPKITWPPIPELLDRLDKSNYTRLARELGVSDNSIRKHIQNYRIKGFYS